MKSFKNHLSLVIALLSILFSLQIFTIVDRAIDAYKENLAQNYSLVVVAQKRVNIPSLLNGNKLVQSVTELSADSVIQKLNSGISKQNMELLKLTLPKFYKLKLKYYPSPSELEDLTKSLLRTQSIEKVETFSKTHDTTYKLLLLFKTVISVFAFTVLVVTVLLIFKELRIWQFKHNERMSIMGLFGAPVWLRSAVLFRLALVDALIASLLSFVIFSYLSAMPWVAEQFNNIGIHIVVFDKVYDFLIMLGVSIVVSLLLATFIVLGHKEEV
ncbi:ABC transporter permease [Sulfurimonas paralvinellae]|uniref:Cell division protein FtsX n=1 Tax=Sulfurimonas paralvinellae TaxID=317658 RepID=A0A7M1B6S4_9BACT|nr:FtsX-like permease family protein [Sulfurimonas paralvinellae]QOP45370.1 cell division protein FtsX [Sulfurimonas paralvinellae]